MSGDDEIAVVLYKGKWYVYHVFAGNAWCAIVYGKVFENYEEAMNFAKNNCERYTEYGICIYGDYDPHEDSRFEKAMIKAGKESLLRSETQS